MSKLDNLGKYFSNILLLLDGDGVISDISGNDNFLFLNSKDVPKKYLFDVVRFYDYKSGRLIENLDELPPGVVSIETDKEAFTVDLNIYKDEKQTVLNFYPLDVAARSIINKSERGSKKDLLDIRGKISHDFNNLLGVIMGHAELANYLSDNEEARKLHMNEVLKSSGKIKNILRQVLVYRHHLDDLPREKVDLKPIIDRCVADAREKIGKSLSIKVKQVNGIYVNQSASRMVDVLGNLIMNAAQAVDEDGNVGIDISTLENGFHQIRITDDGIGMSRKSMEQMFEPFYSTHSRMAAAGVGLSIAKGILDDVGGGIDIISELGKGTVVTVQIPVYVQEVQKGNVLLVDDEEMVLGVTGDLVESLGYNVVRCEDIPQGETALNNQLFDVMLIDHHLADRSGLELIKYARDKGIRTPAILSCGHHCEKDFTEEKIDGFLMKPTSMSDIEKMFNSVLLK